MEFVWLKQAGYPQQKGFLGMAGFSFHQNSFSGNLSASFFETDGYDTRIYIYESDLLYNYSLPAYFERGLHYHINLRKDFNNLFRQAGKHFRITGWIKWGQTYYPGYSSIGSGLDG